jgi:hypothetical protein
VSYARGGNGAVAGRGPSRQRGPGRPRKSVIEGGEIDPFLAEIAKSSAYFTVLTDLCGLIELSLLP